MSIHVPQTNDTKGFINESKIAVDEKGVRILNFVRRLVVNKDLLAGIESENRLFCNDFADEDLLGNDKLFAFHTWEHQLQKLKKLRFMAVNQIRDFLENGNITNSVNFPQTKLEEPIPAGGGRLCIADKNVPNMVGQITTILAAEKVNISGMVNKISRFSLQLIDVESCLTDSMIEKLRNIEGVIEVRLISNC